MANASVTDDDLRFDAFVAHWGDLFEDEARGAIEYPAGWATLIDHLFMQIGPVLEAHDGKVVELRERHAALRCEVVWAPDAPPHARDEVRGLIEDARAESKVTCIVCATPGEVRLMGWAAPFCDEHAEAYRTRQISRSAIVRRRGG